MDVICFLQWSGSGIWILLGWVCHWKGREDVEFPKAQWVEEACQAPPYYLKGILLKVRTATVNLSHSWFCPIILIINYLFLDPNSSFPTKQRKKCSWILRIIWKKKKTKQRTLLQTLCILVSIKPCLDKVLFYYFILQSADSSWSLSASTSGVVKLT